MTSPAADNADNADNADRGAAAWHPATVAAAAVGLAVFAFLLAPTSGVRTAAPLASVPRVLAPLAPLAAFAAAAALAASGGRPALRRWLFWTAASWLPIAISLVLVHGLVFPEGRMILVRLGPLAVTAEGLAFAAATAARWLAASGAIALVGALCRPAAIVQALEASSLPGGLGHAAAGAVLLVPTARHAASDIRAAQRARGLVVDGSLVRRAASLAPLVVPLAVQLIVDGQDRAAAVAARGFAPGRPMRHAWPLPDSPSQRRLRRAILAAAVLGIVLRLVATWS
ncbi:MAG: energy-coupling factor transporter transmembrane component T [Ardenticatenales bacterium]